MPTAPLYTYQQIYGCSAWKSVAGRQYSDAAGTVVEADGPFGGGTLRDNENLLSSLWTITDILDINGFEVPNEGAQLRPTYSFEGQQPVARFVRTRSDVFRHQRSSRVTASRICDGP